MRDFADLHLALKRANDSNLIDTFSIHNFYLDIDFHISSTSSREKHEVQKILKLRDFIKDNYDFVHCVDYMPGLNRLRLYGNFESIK